jgi:hypothetical protein
MASLLPEDRATLQKNAPETLAAPVADQFSDPNSYQTALAKFNANGHWATPSAGDISSGTFKDPAGVSGARDNPLYIGPTNFANIQRSYTPYQIEQATVRDASGNISWKQGVDINGVPREAPPSTLTTPKPGTATTNQIMTGSGAAGSKLTTSDPSFQLSGAVSAATAGYVDGITKRLDDLTNTQQQLIEKKKAEAEANRGGIIDKIKSKFDTTQQQDSLKADRELFQVTQTVNSLNTIRQKLADASSALNQGLIYEENQPVRMALLVGRSSELKKQGLAHIGALQSTAEILQGNIDLARAYADQSLTAIKGDNAEKTAALNTLLELYNDDLVDLTDEERDLVDYRKSLLENENARLDDDKDKLLGLAEQFPDSFTKGGVTFVDSPEKAMQKMLPHLSEQERIAMEKARLELADIRAGIKKKASGGGGGGGGLTGDTGDIYSSMAQDVMELRQAGKTEAEINLFLMSEYGNKFAKRTDLIAVMDQVLQGATKPTPERTPKQILEDQTAIEDLKEKGLDAQGNPLPAEPEPEKKWWQFWK